MFGRAKPDEAAAERLVSAYHADIRPDGVNRLHEPPDPANYATGRAILDAPPGVQVKAIIAMTCRHDHLLSSLAETLKQRDLPWTADDVRKLIPPTDGNCWQWSPALALVARFLSKGERLSGPLQSALRARYAYISLPTANSYDRRERKRLGALLGVRPDGMPVPGEAWSDSALGELGSMAPDARGAFLNLLATAACAEGSAPTAAWRKEAREAVTRVGEAPFRSRVFAWFAAVKPEPVHGIRMEIQGRSSSAWVRIAERNETLLRGLAWMCADLNDGETARVLGWLAEETLRKLPREGPWAIRAGGSAIWALSEMSCPEAVAELTRLRKRLTYRAGITQVERALERAAARAGISKADLEDLNVPDFGLDHAGEVRATFGDCSAVARITAAGAVETEWFAPNGAHVKAPPAAARRDHAAAVRDFKKAVEAASGQLSAQKFRFESFWVPERVWSVHSWRERYADHPLLGSVARRLIWSVGTGERRADCLWDDQRRAFVEQNAQALPWADDDSEVRLWHPIGKPVDAVLAWRSALEERGIVQPFKQAHREVYLLTDAERQTATYSNRFAGHILKQHPMHAIAGARGWRHQLFLAHSDAGTPAEKLFPELGLRAEFVAESSPAESTIAGGIAESGVILNVATDRVYFSRILSRMEMDARWKESLAAHRERREPQVADIRVPLGEVPPLLFSEVMRDVDLFVSVCSIGNDPIWRDGGPDGRYAAYWQQCSLGDLTETATTRRDVLQRLLPRLKIADRCTLTDRHLVVRGELHTYRIHLGSASVLMSPGDRFLCIVAAAAPPGDAATPFLPYEGDGMLAVILSKALLLADDRHIRDPVILQQFNQS